MSYLSAFTNQLEAFSSELSVMFPEDVDLKMALNMIKLIKKANPRKLLMVFDKFTVDYKAEIMARDENFFIKHSFDELADKTGKSDYTYSLVTQLKSHWTEMSQDSKDATWQYFIVLFKLSEKINSTPVTGQIS